MKLQTLCAQNLTIGYQNQKGCKIIAQNINLELHSGKLIAVVGSNGIGKTTLLKTLSGIQKPIFGNLFLDSIAIQKYDLGILSKHISLVLTDKLLVNNLTVFDVVALGRQPYTNWIGKLLAVDLQHIQNALESTNLIAILDKRCEELSDGQLQKVMIARAIAQNTTTIILDEPTTHLDLVNSISVLKLLQNVAHKHHKCVLFSTHDIQKAILICDEIIVITKDNVTQDSPKNLIERGVFDQLFEDENIVFDVKTNDFLIR